MIRIHFFLILNSFLLGLFAASSVLAAEGAPAGTVELNNQGIELFKKQNFMGAQDKFAQGLARSPYLAQLQLNLGLAFDGAGNKEKAAQAYTLAAKMATDKETLFAANFNLAELAGKEKKVDEALSYYQLALQAKPDSIEAKTNIELLTQDQQGGKDGSKDDKDKKDNKDKKDKDQKDKNQDQKDKDKDKDKKGQDQKDQDKKDQGQDQDKDQKDQPKKEGYQKDKPQPRPFKSEQLSQGDVKRILDELNRQEQRVRAEYNKKQVKEKPRDKDW